MSGLIAIFAALLAFAVPLAVPLFALRWRSFVVIALLGAAFFAWLTWDIQRPGSANIFGTFLGGLMLFGFTGGAIAKFVMLLSRRP